MKPQDARDMKVGLLFTFLVLVLLEMFVGLPLALMGWWVPAASIAGFSLLSALGLVGLMHLTRRRH
jgi:CHASE2 domain-containing sensor protein